MNVGLLFGSFNPLHIGHLIIAEYMCQFHDEIWIVLSPQNPFKKSTDLLDEKIRLKLIELALEGNDKIKVSTVEFNLPKPSYTVNTLKHLNEECPNTDFSIIMGSDNVLGINKWRESEYILDQNIFVYPRIGYKVKKSFIKELPENVQFTEAPIIELSSTYIRKQLETDNPNVQYMLHDDVWKYIITNNLYR
ncbi:MAG: nicotinate-nucleotide adenylyltransferase [Patiriisocius sp.]|jgi:nicotinate-nucleotide adenylyltransferase